MSPLIKINKKPKYIMCYPTLAFEINGEYRHDTCSWHDIVHNSKYYYKLLLNVNAKL